MSILSEKDSDISEFYYIVASFFFGWITCLITFKFLLMFIISLIRMVLTHQNSIENGDTSDDEVADTDCTKR